MKLVPHRKCLVVIFLQVFLFALLLYINGISQSVNYPMQLQAEEHRHPQKNTSSLKEETKKREFEDHPQIEIGAKYDAHLPMVPVLEEGNIASIPSHNIANVDNQKYLFYYSHSGFSNQLIGLARAAQLAHSTNRTLILPPILPHKDDGDGRSAGTACNPYIKSGKFIRIAKLDATKCLGAPKNTKYVKFSEIIDLSKLSQTTNVTFVDLCEFVEKEPVLTLQYFHPESPVQKVDLDGYCTIHHRRPYSKMVNHFQSIFSNSTVAIIPSAFVIRSSNSQSEAFSRNFLVYPPSSNLLAVIHSVRARLPPDYIGLHMRYKDKYNSEKCFSENKTEVSDMIQHENMAMMEKDGTNGTSSVFIASNSQKVVTCYKQFLRKAGFRTLSLSDVLEKDSSVLASIKVPLSTIYLVLDQIMVSLGNRVVLQSKMGISTFQSTFQRVIVEWNTERSELKLGEDWR
mmetsp:Transcript_56022/g.65448  ORF Transcript_56022/g.65448 Transcript_56022/m.65448 type:complete len:457 (+) Transcript_56022:328-1698(+)